MRYRVLPYRQGSKGARSLANSLPRGKVLKLLGSHYVPSPDDLIINWGNTKYELYASTMRILNRPVLVRQASNKLMFFGHMKNEGCEDIIPDFWTRAEDIPDEAFPIVCRTVLAGHSGDGIVLAANRDQLVPAPLYVKYIPKKDEYRVHVGKTSAEIVTGTEGDPERTVIIAVQRKARRHDTPNEAVNWKVRNHSNGFIFQRGGIDPPSDVLRAARRSLLAIGLDFGAVDIIWNEKKGCAYALEINTAPGLEGQTIKDYAAYFQSIA